jgi:CHASE3 domain sensor protein
MSKPTRSPSRLGQTLRTVGSALFGVRASKRHAEDASALSPLGLILVAGVVVVLLVLVLVWLASIAASG